MAAEFRKGFVKSDYSPDVFRSRGLSSREGAARGSRGLHTPCSRGQVVWATPCPSLSRLLAPGVFGENRDFAIISGVFLKVDFLHKNETPGQLC